MLDSLRFPARSVGLRALLRPLVAAVVAGLVAALAGQGAGAVSYPLTLTDAVGSPVALPDRPERVVSLVPSVTEGVCAIGACELLVGVDNYSDYPPPVQKLPRLGGLYDPNPEAIVALRPDLVLASKYGRLPETLRQAGLRVFVIQSETYEEIFQTLEVLGRLLDREQEAGELVLRLKGQVARIEAAVGKRAERPSVYYEIDETPYTAGPGSFIGGLIARAGGRNIVPPDLGLFPKISPEFVVMADPDVIILADYPYGVTPERIRQRPGWAQLRALAAGRVVGLTSEEVNLLNRPGPRVAQALEVLARILHPGFEPVGQGAAGQP